ncbi:hypothetical protein [Streptomyces sp. NPDC053069]|uniref:hypothetical protein n=1 Tax=Streptomyces sp. NPDC053069 TaxID=3365695 RepID=UPI0037CCD926
MFGVGATLISRMLYEATDDPSLAGAFATSALNAGAAPGPVLGGAVIDGGLGRRSPGWVGALLVTFALAALGGVRRGGRERQSV